ncbi:MAG: autoinducer 2 ABC transporter substrate-binding protein LsrB [Termitinemataceae bacterium]|nr:MAG: autoinducer 2 ABC transporter substrate-binding protein LsrB [Termitinemataceae bacterium]
MKKVFLVLVAAAVLFTGCKGKEGGKKTIVFVPKISGNAFFETANDGAQAIGKELGFTVKYNGSPDAAVANQVTIIRTAISQGVDGISVSSLDSTALDSVMKEAMAAGIAVTTWDSDVSGDARTVMVSQGTPDVLGKMLVDMSVQSLNERGKKADVDAIKYAWHYSQSTVADQNSWRVSGEAYIKANFPNWVNVRTDNYYSNQDAELAITTGEAILKANENIDLIICNDSTALPGQLQAAQNLGYNKDKVTITGFAPPNSIKPYARDGITSRWGLWDSGKQGAIGVYLAYYIASGNKLKVGDSIDIPTVGKVTVEPNTILDPSAYTAENSGVVLLPERVVFTTENMDQYNF